MRVQEVNVVNPDGLHARLAAKVAVLACQFGAQLSIACNGRAANARNIVGVMALGAAAGRRLRVEAEGADEQEALEALCGLLAGRNGRDLT
jgi:phosphocarrier protein